MLELNNKNKLLGLISAGAIVITPNNRLSAALLESFFAYSQNKILEKPICLPYSTIITNAYQQLKFTRPEQSHPTLLNEAQLRHLWQKIIKSEANITYSDGLLMAVMQAYEYCQQWQISCENPTFCYTPQTKTFQQWWQILEQKLKEQNLITEHQLIPYLVNSNYPLVDQPIIWACFDEFNPQQLTLQNYHHNQGLTQYRYDLKEQTTSPQVLTAKDHKEEYQQLFAWLRLKLDQGIQRIGVVIPNLQQESRSLQRIIEQHFDSSLFNISLGQTLSDFPLVAHALVWLKLEATNIDTHQVSLLLQSPYLGGAKEEFIARSHYLQESTLLQNPLCSLKTLSHDLETPVPKLSALLKDVTPYPKSAPIDEWIHLFQQRLNSLGYPGDYGLNSQNYQCFHRFTAVFDEFRQLSLISPILTTKEAIEAFSYLIDNTIFQAQKKNTIIQISGLLEASGCEFDSLWVMGLTDQCLPQKTRLSAFIPPQLQRQLFMPHSVPERELQFARQTLQRLHRGSKETVFSYPKLMGDTPNLPCSLITHLPPIASVALTNETLNSLPLITQEEQYNVPLGAEESVSGGTALLANQAKCPFKAFAEHRLKAKPLQMTTDGLDHKEKGQLIHKVMELLWSTIENQERLLNFSEGDLDQLIEKTINTALAPYKQAHPDSFPTLIQEVEYIRLKRLVQASLEWEKTRVPFTITAIEQTYSVNIAGLDFTVRVDRLDQVANQKWVIDYKSTLPTSKPWNEERPREPQLLLYALLDEEINTLLLLQLKTGKIICSGFSEEKQAIHGISSLKKEESWDEYRNNWKEQLSLLAEEFQNGYCPPQPLSPSICQQCAFQNLCRFQAN
ncbi:PD-(D/E)XK nuclease family protein [Legionella fallonii]|uniref:PD-(D/E)XK endonuclease-like domain-containing protein n=1 Tax=Legionella fallonii LLAP-10 TaxID=1212491 RepID=A0A098G7P0_9GAMM|nr:PD-(D/E)XK nuclease family protein [Legionella fallonii]CEG58472.1 conserved exported protein of unknown function [Legionella fallonii LLAP-10]